MNIIVDTNIVFSAIITAKSKNGEILLNPPPGFHFTSVGFLVDELTLHSNKILKLTGYTISEYQQVKEYVIQNIKFINPGDISQSSWFTAYSLLKDIDEKDVPFLALTLEMQGILWTGDKKLIKGLQSKNFTDLITTDILYQNYFTK